MPNTVLHCFNCTRMMKPCRCKGFMPTALFKCRSFSNVFKYLCRGARRRRSSKRFRSVHAVFWPLMSMRSDERDRAADNNPSLTMTETETIEAHDQTFARPQPNDQPVSINSTHTKTELSPPPASSSYTKVQPSPLISSSNANSELQEITTKAESSHSPLTSSRTKVEPAPHFASSYIKMATQLNAGDQKKTREDNSEVQKACRSFEKYILEMLLEERKVRDLLDVEELLYCMDNLKSPAFVELVCTFYGELCLDLFSDDQGEGEQSVLEPGGNY